MKSKFAQLKSTTAHQNVGDSTDLLNTFDFVRFYKTEAETSKSLKNDEGDENNVSKATTENKIGTAKGEHGPLKNEKKNRLKPVDVSHIIIDASSLNSKAGARPQPSSIKYNTKQGSLGQVKSIMKNKSFDEGCVSPKSTTSNGKPKKRNKSVSFMLEENEEIMVKRTKSDEPSDVNKNSENAYSHAKNKHVGVKKRKKYQQSEKENKATDLNKQKRDVDSSSTSLSEKKIVKDSEPECGLSSSNIEIPVAEERKKFKKLKNFKSASKPDVTETEGNNNEISTVTKNKNKKYKKKKHIKRTPLDLESGDGDDEPVAKSRKKDSKPDIVEDLENLSIGDNTHTLTNMLDEMTVVDKGKNKKLRQKFNKNKIPKGPNKEDVETSEEVKEKVKWKKRKWNKDKKGELNDEALETTVIVDNLPLGIMLNYKKLLTDHFIKYGLIKRVGIAEVYPTEESKPVFTTTITFNSDGAAQLALEDDNTTFEGSRIRVRRPLPATETTLVVRSYGELNDQNICTALLGVGKIRSIRHVVKGKKSVGTSFVEFDGPEAVERAVAKMADMKIGGKKVHLAKYEARSKKKKSKKPKNEDSAADADSEDSND